MRRRAASDAPPSPPGLCQGVAKTGMMTDRLMPQGSEQSRSTAPAIPRRMSIALVLILLAAGAYLAWRMGWDRRGTGSQTVVIDQTERPRYNSQGLFKDPDGIIRGRAGDVTLRAYPRSGGGRIIRVDYAPETRQSWVTPQQYDMHAQAVRILSYTRLAEYVALTSEQRKELTALNADLALTDAQREKLNSLLDDWEKADDRARSEARAAVLRMLMDIGAQYRDATRQAMLERVSRIGSILTGEQLAKARKWTPSLLPVVPASRPAAAAATRPATPRAIGRMFSPATQSAGGAATGKAPPSTAPVATP